VQPQPKVSLQNNNGTLAKTVGFFTKQLERKSVRLPRHKSGAAVCSLAPKDKFLLFVRDSFDPGTFLVAGFHAGLDQAEDRDPSFGQGAAGYGKRYGASFADQASFRFFKDFAYPSIIGEDPRYYPLIHGSAGRRIFHAIGHAFVAHRDNGDLLFNFSEWLGTASAVTLSNMYHPGNQRGFTPTSQLVGYRVLSDMGFDVLREFWPEISHKFSPLHRAEPATKDFDSNLAGK
jgi:hypothetical protein